MHCDTISVIDHLQREGQTIGLRNNSLNVSLEKMQKGDYLLQNFAMFTPLKELTILFVMCNVLLILII